MYLFIYRYNDINGTYKHYTEAFNVEVIWKRQKLIFHDNLKLS